MLVPPDRLRPPSPPTVAAPRPRQQTADVVVAAQDVSKVYGHGLREVRAVISASLQVRRGSIVGIAGSSDCGKSTLLRLLATIEPPGNGSIMLGGQIATPGGNTRIQRGLTRSGFVMPIFQGPLGSLDRRWPIWRSVTEPLTAAHRAARLSRARRRELAREQLAQVGLAGMASFAEVPVVIWDSQRMGQASACHSRATSTVAIDPALRFRVVYRTLWNMIPSSGTDRQPSHER